MDLAGHCKKCNKGYYTKSKEKRLMVAKKWYGNNKDRVREQHKTAVGRVTRLMADIKYRCGNIDNKYYGGCGIRLEFTRKELENYLSERGIDPRGLEIHRKNNGGNYTLDNIEFLVKSEHTKLHWKNSRIHKGRN